MTGKFDYFSEVRIRWKNGCLSEECQLLNRAASRTELAEHALSLSLACSSVDGSPSHFYEFDKLGGITNGYRGSNELETGAHELRMSEDGYALFGIRFRTMDVRELRGSPNATVRGLVVEYHRPGRKQFLWNTFDHLEWICSRSRLSGIVWISLPSLFDEKIKYSLFTARSRLRQRFVAIL